MSLKKTNNKIGTDSIRKDTKVKVLLNRSGQNYWLRLIKTAAEGVSYLHDP